MKLFILCSVLLLVSTEKSNAVEYENITLLYEPAARQLLEYKIHNSELKLWTKSSGDSTEIRELRSINSDQFNNQLLLDDMTSLNGERIPERIIHGKGIGAFGYFEVTHDVSKYTYADVFNGIGKKTPVVVRLSSAYQSVGGSDVARDFKGLAVKFYTKQGNLDLLCFSTPVFPVRDPNLYLPVVHVFKKNPKTTLVDFTAIWDLVVLEPIMLHSYFWVLADFGVPDGYRKMDAFPIHTFEIANEHGETYYIRFNFRTEQGFAALTSSQAAAIQAIDLDYYSRDLYNNIENKNYPSWRLEMDILTKYDLLKVPYNPFDVNQLWINGTFFTVQIGRLVLNRNVDNQFRDTEQGAFNPSNLVPGIPGPVDWMFRVKRNSYLDAQNYRLGRNHNKILINRPLYVRNYNRDGVPSVASNGRDSPNYYPNSFNGPVPYVDEKRPKEKLQILTSNAVDLEPAWYFYNYVIDNEAHRQRFIQNIVLTLVPVTPPTIQKVLKMFYRIDPDLAARVSVALPEARAAAVAQRVSAAAIPAPPIINLNTSQAWYNYHDDHIKYQSVKDLKKISFV